MTRLTPGELPGPGIQALVPITEQMHQAFARCPHVPAMLNVLTSLKEQAVQLVDDQVAHHCGRSWFTGSDLRLGVSYGHDPDLTPVFGQGQRWHLSLSESGNNRREPAGLPELLAWVMTGWPATTRLLAYTIAGGYALHADLPADLTSPLPDLATAATRPGP